jgi:hypothetical protein
MSWPPALGVASIGRLPLRHAALSARPEAGASVTEENWGAKRLARGHGVPEVTDVSQFFISV